ncbi:Muscle, skeletal receptor tyrosine kinase [Paramuricea clavata]|uniref:Muscle, skeletal receptor tyrosine kinase n=2 Tax=Paramuricea clavata TaxID=317549 RepID=A0A7D9DTY4_PARCT|nr:Muscle, skeletal receptor tyrosine kinase [Paramuricea clavata]
MDLGFLRVVFLVLIGISGCNTLTTVVSTTAINKTILASSITPSQTPKITSTPSNATIISSLSISAHNGTIHNSSIMVTSTLHKGPHPTSTPTTQVKPTSTPSPPKPGFCAKYNRQPCQDVLNRSWTQFNETERYFDSKLGINGSEMFLSLMLQESDRQITNDPRCKWLIEVALCQYTLSPCMPDDRPVSICREDCESLTQECKVSLNRLIGSADILTNIKKYDFAHLVLPTNCSYYPSGKTGNHSCVYIGLFDHSKTSSKTSQEILWISIGAGSAFLLILLFIIILTCCKKQRRKKLEEGIELAEVTLRPKSTVDYASTMKARLSQMLEMRSSLSSKIAEMFDPSKLKQFSLDNIEYISDLGEGQFGLVFKGAASGIDDCEEASEQTIVAVKTLKKDSNESSQDEFNQEVALMSVLDHPNIVKLLAVATEEEPYCMIFEFMEFGDLNQFLRKIKPIDGSEEVPELELCLEDSISICQQVASGMSYLASLHFVHRDLATRNCLVGTGLVVKIADFGLARDIYSSDYYKVRGDAMLPVRWMPPEAVLHGKFTVESDVYSYGILIWEVFTYALQPYYGYTNEEVIGFAKQGVLLGQPDDCPNHIYNLMLDCWNRTSEKRPDFTMIIKRLVKDPPVSDYCTPRTLSVTAEEPGENVAMTLDEPVGKIPVPKPVKPENHYVLPGAIVNCGFKSDNGECSNGKAETLPVVHNKSENEVLAERYSNITAV